MSSSSTSCEEFTSESSKRQKIIDFDPTVRSFDFTPISPDTSVTFSASQWNSLCQWAANVSDYLEFQQLQMTDYHNKLTALQTQIQSMLPLPMHSSTNNRTMSMNQQPPLPPAPSYAPSQPMEPSINSPTISSSENPFITVLPKKKSQHRRSTTYAHAAAATPSTVPSSKTTPATPSSTSPTTNSSSYQPPKLHHRTQLKSINSTEEKLHLLLRKATPPVESVASIYFHAQLSRQAMKDPIHSIKTLFQTVTDIPALGISLISPTQFEVFLPKESIPTVQHRLSSKLTPSMEFNQIPNPNVDLSEKDVKRRAATYNRSHFQLLRRACLNQFPLPLQLQVLAHAKSCLPNLSPDRQKSLTKAIQEDELWVQSNIEEMNNL